MEKKLEYIKLKVELYKSTYPWIIAMVAGNLGFIQFINVNHQIRNPLITLLSITSIIFLIITLISEWYVAFILIQSLEEKEPFKSKSRLLNFFLWKPRGANWELAFDGMASFCLGGGVAAFCAAILILYRNMPPF